MARIQADSGTLPSTMAQQFFVIGSALAGGLAGILISRELAKVQDVPLPLVVGTTIVSAIFTLGAGIYLAQKAGQNVGY